MLGLIPKILIDLLDEQAGRSAVESVLARAGLPADHRFRLGTVYSDEVWQTLLAAALDVLGLDQATAEKAYAD